MDPQNKETESSNKAEQTAREAVNEIIAKMEQQVTQRYEEIQKEQDAGKRADLEQQLRADILRKLKDVQTVSQEASEIATDKSKGEDFKEKAKDVKSAYLEADEVRKQFRGLGDDKVSKSVELISKGIREGMLTDRDLIDIQSVLGKDIQEGILLSGEGQEKTQFEKDLLLLKDKNIDAAGKLSQLMIEDPTKFNMDRNEMTEKLGAIFNEGHEGEESTQDRRRRASEDPDLARFHSDEHLYAKFSDEDRNFLEKLYKTETFEKEVSDRIDKLKNDSHEVEHIKHKIVNVYKKANQPLPTETELQQEVEKHIMVEVSEQVGKKLIDIMNNLYWRVQIEKPHKFFEEIEKEDFMYGIETTRLKISTTLERLIHSLEEQEKKPGYNTRYLYKHGEEDYTIEERDVDGKMRQWLRTKPLPVFNKVPLSEYAKSLFNNLGHWRHRSEYLHNARAIFNHPAHGEEGFFGQLGGYAEKLGGTDIDEMMLLPDGQMTYDAYILYDKLVEEEFAANDWRHRPNQFTNSLEEVNTKVEKEVIELLRKLYPKESDDALKHSINSAVGIARGVFMTETEKSAYADAIDPEGKGMFASYATNDATALQTFNPLHVMLRWQGEHMLPMFYFMESQGSGMTWDHAKTWKDAAKYFDSLKKGKGDLMGKNLFIDGLIDNLGVGGMFKRKGWRMSYSLEGHNIYEPGTNNLNHLETFKAMDAIGYEAISDFLKFKVDKKILKALPGSNEAVKMDEMFSYIFDRYFKPFGDTDYKGYMAELRKEGEIEAKKILKKTGTLPNGSMEAETNVQTALLFIDNTLAREVALRFPSKFLKIDRSRFTQDGISRFTKVQQELNMTRDDFNKAMKDFSYVETVLRRRISEYIKESSHLFPGKGLNNFNNFEFEINEASIREIMGDAAKGGHPFDAKEINDVVSIWRKMKELYLNPKFLDKEGFSAISGYKFTFGLEDTDFTLMAMRNTGPRMIARSIKDTAVMEKITPWIIEMPRLLNQIAISGKHDFSPIIEYLQKAQNAITQVHGTGDDFKYIYRIASAAIQYFKKDTAAKPLFGLFRLGKKNSIAAEIAGRSSAVWEWDSRDIDRFCVALESFRLLPKDAFKLDMAPVMEDKYVNIFGKAIKMGKQRRIDYEWNSAKLRKEFGGDWKAISADYINQFLPVIAIFILFQYIKKAYEETSGKKK